MQEYTADNPSEVTQDTQTDGDSVAAVETSSSANGSTVQTETNQDVSKTKAFSQRLNEMSEKKAEAVRSEYAEHEKLMRMLNEKGYEGSAEEIAQTLFSQQQDKQTQEEKEADPLKSLSGHPAVQWAKDIIDERTFDADLAAIKNVYPDITQQSVWELGDIYIKLMLSGTVDAVTAYETQLAYNARGAQSPAPPSAGSARSGGMMPEKEYYTPDEVDRLTSEDYDNPRIMQRVRRSMTKWK